MPPIQPARPLLGLFAASLCACASAPSASSPPPPAAAARAAVERVRAQGEPSLEDIFSVPGVHGIEPRAVSLSADGRALLFAWSPTSKGEDGLRGTRERPELRLMVLADPERHDGQGLPLWTLLPATEEFELGEGGNLLHAWSEGGARLALARGAELHMVELDAAGSWSLRTLHVNASPAPAPADGAPTRTLGKVSDLRFSPDDAELYVWASGELYAFDPTATSRALEDARWVSEPLDRGLRSVRWSQDLALAFRADGGLLPEDAADDDGAAQVLHLDGLESVVLEGFAELEGRGRGSLSPDGSFVMATRTDRSGEPERNLVPDYLTERVSTRSTRRERAEDGARPTELHLWDTRTGAHTSLAFQGERADWIRSIGWAPQPTEDAPARLALVRTSPDFRTRELWCWDEAQGWRRLTRERDRFWVGGPAGGPRWSGDGSVLLLPSERIDSTSTPGRCQLFAVHPEDGTVRQLTAVAGEVDDIRTTKTGGIALTASAQDPATRTVHWLSGEDVAGNATVLPEELSTRDPRPPSPDLVRRAEAWSYFRRPLASPDGGTIVAHGAGLGRPLELFACRGPSGSRALTSTVPEDFASEDWILPQRLSVEASDGTPVASHVYLPRGTDLEHPDRPRATIVFVHGAGYLQNVTDSMTEYAVNLMFHSRLAHMGYVVVDVDYRGSKGYGADFRGAVQHHLGGLDLGDIHDTLDVLVERGLVDPERVGLYGGSYGGFLTLMALFTAPERWSAGAALRSVTDWRSYHPGYTQPRLGRPSTHPEAYARSSPIDLFEGLEDPLLILHGLVDSNVFAQDSIRLMEELIDHGLPFEAMLYPSQGHGFTDGPHWIDEYDRIERFLIGHLGAP